MKQGKREQILRAAAAQFAEKGYEGASIRAIAEAAGVNIAMISYYFGGKRGLYEEAFTSQLSALQPFLTLDAETEPPLRIFQCYAETAAAVHEDSPYLLPYLYRILLSPSTDAGPIFARYVSQMFHQLCRAAVRGQEAGLIRTDLDPKSAVLLFAGGINFHFLSRRIRAHIDRDGTLFPEEKSYIRQALSIFFQGIERRDPS